MFNIDVPDFQPPWYLRNPHLQTVVGNYLRFTNPPTETVARPLALTDGDRLILHDDCPANRKPSDRVALLMHGLSGSYLSPYLVRTAAKLNDIGVRTFRMDLRGHGAGYALAQHFGHAGRSEDIAPALEFISELCPDSPVTLIGFSLSGNIALKYLAERSGATHPLLDSTITVSPPIDLAACGKNLRQGIKRFYDRTFVKTLKHLATRRHREVAELDKLASQLPARLWEFDDQYTAPRSGFDGVDDYYERSSSGPLLNRVDVPTLIITSLDDPLVPASIYEQYTMSSSITLQTTTHGGHLGFIGRTGIDPDCRWLDWRIVDWVQSMSISR